ncbi:MAG TPA: hypothetical protein ENH25_10500 [candidate division Zixibacteria bacterium]|nr:hypothetical protein [candidate division Zixibacteria bacterium]
MARAPFQVLVIPYYKDENGNIVYAVFKRRPDNGDFWQPIAGGGEDDETPLQAACREDFDPNKHIIKSRRTGPIPNR